MIFITIVRNKNRFLLLFGLFYPTLYMTDLVRGIVIPQIIKSVRNRIRTSICDTLQRSAFFLLLETSIFYAIIMFLQHFDRSPDIAIYIHGLLRTLHVTLTFCRLGWKINRFKEKYIYVYTFQRKLDIYTFAFIYLGSLQLLLWFWYDVGLTLSIISLSLLFFLYKEVIYAYSLQFWILNKEILIYLCVYLIIYISSTIIIH